MPDDKTDGRPTTGFGARREVIDRQMSPEEIAAETSRGKVAAIFAFVASLTTIAAFVVRASELTTKTKLDDAEALLHLHANRNGFILYTVLASIAVACMAPVLLHMAVAVRSRRPSVQSMVVIFSLAGPLLLALSTPLYTLLRVSAAKDFFNDPVQTVKHAEDLMSTSALGIVTGMVLAGTVGLAFAFLLVAMNSQRIGLVTRFFGIIGIVIAVATMFAPLPASVLQVFWLGALGMTFLAPLERRPPAWGAGRPAEHVRPGPAEASPASSEDDDPADFSKAGS
ncbi:MAG: hypothetical protein WAP35_03995 [Solirubrobacterales bacterium]